MGEQGEGIVDSGWRIMAGDETQAYLDDSENVQVRSLGAILNIDETIIAILDEPVGSEFEWDDSREKFVKVKQK